MSTYDQGTKWHRNIAENFNRLSYRQTDRQTTAGRTYSEREREFMFAKNVTMLPANGCYYIAN